MLAGIGKNAQDMRLLNDGGQQPAPLLPDTAKQRLRLLLRPALAGIPVPLAINGSFSLLYAAGFALMCACFTWALLRQEPKLISKPAKGLQRLAAPILFLTGFLFAFLGYFTASISALALFGCHLDRAVFLGAPRFLWTLGFILTPALEGYAFPNQHALLANAACAAFGSLYLRLLSDSPSALSRDLAKASAAAAIALAMHGASLNATASMLAGIACACLIPDKKAAPCKSAAVPEQR